MLVRCHYSEHAEKYGFGVVERFVGHGVGAVFHSEPIILHHRKKSSKFDISLILPLLYQKLILIPAFKNKVYIRGTIVACHC